MKGDSRWVTTLHYAFQDEEYLVRILSEGGGCCPGTKEEGLGCQGSWVQGERDPSYRDQEASTGHPLLGPEPLPELCWESAALELLAGRWSCLPRTPRDHEEVGGRQGPGADAPHPPPCLILAPPLPPPPIPSSTW